MIIPIAKLQRNLLRCLRLFVLRHFRRRGRGSPVGAMQQLLQQPLGLAAVALRLVPIHRIAWRRSSPGERYGELWKNHRLRKKMDMDGQGYNDI